MYNEMDGLVQFLAEWFASDLLYSSVTHDSYSRTGLTGSLVELIQYDHFGHGSLHQKNDYALQVAHAASRSP